MRSRTALIVTLLAATAAAQSGQEPEIRIDADFSVRLQQLYVTASRGEQRVLDLSKDDFEVLDNGVPQEIVTFAHGDIPFTAVLLVDCSLSMTTEKLNTALAGTRAFAAGMRKLDEASLIAFSDRVLLSSPFGEGARLATLDVATLRGEGGTAVNDHLYLALKLLEQRQGRRAVILLSDGVDIESTLAMREVQHKQRQSQAMIFWIRPPERSGHVLDPAAARRRSSSWRSGEAHASELKLLLDVVRDSGGRVVPVQFLDDLRPSFNDVLAELREQYAIGYYPSNAKNDQSWHEVTVRVRRPGITARTRGYIDF